MGKEGKKVAALDIADAPGFMHPTLVRDLAKQVSGFLSFTP
jgi:predicted protein tyrosine phosphatase